MVCSLANPFKITVTEPFFLGACDCERSLALPQSSRCWFRATSADSNHSVTSYATASGLLTLQHQFPKSTEVQALVDVRLLLEKLTAEQTSVGEWVNVIGYINSPPSSSVNMSTKRKRGLSAVHVQALMLWSAGSLDIGRYEMCLASISAGNEPGMASKTSRKT